MCSSDLSEIYERAKRMLLNQTENKKPDIKENLYGVLQVNKNASYEVIKAAYRSLILSNPQKRYAYDIEHFG